MSEYLNLATAAAIGWLGATMWCGFAPWSFVRKAGHRLGYIDGWFDARKCLATFTASKGTEADMDLVFGILAKTHGPIDSERARAAELRAELLNSTKEET